MAEETRLPDGLCDVSRAPLGFTNHEKSAWSIGCEEGLRTAQTALQALAAEKDALESRAELAEQAHVCAAEERDHLRALMKDLRPDAARYRWLRELPVECPTDGLDIAMWNDCHGDGIRGDALDAAIDSALAQKEGT